MLQLLKFVVLSCLTFIQGLSSLNKVDICFGDNRVTILTLAIAYLARIEWVNILRNC